MNRVALCWANAKENVTRKGGVREQEGRLSSAGCTLGSRRDDELIRCRHGLAVNGSHATTPGTITIGRQTTTGGIAALGADGTGPSSGTAHDRPRVATVRAAGAGTGRQGTARVARLTARARRA